MITHRIRIDEDWIEITDQPEIYLFTDESCTKREWVPFNITKVLEQRRWLLEKRIRDHIYIDDSVEIRFRLRDSTDLNKFMEWMQNTAKVSLKTYCTKDIEYAQSNDNILNEHIKFINSMLSSMSDNCIVIRTDWIV